MDKFEIPQNWQYIVSVLVAIILIVPIAFALRAVSPFAAATPTPTENAVAMRPRPTVPPTFTPTPSPTVPASPTATATPSPTPTRTPTPAPTPIVVDVTKLGQLTSVKVKMQTVVSQSRSDEPWWKNLFGKDKVLLLAVGNVYAGIDITAIAPTDMVITRDRITMKIPHATISSVELLPDESQVIDNQRRIAFSDYPGLEKEAFDAARTQLRNWAETEAGVLPMADELAKSQLTNFLQKLGFNHVTIIFKEGGSR